MNEQCDSVEVISGPVFVLKGKDNEVVNTELVVLKENGIPIA